MVTRLPKPGTYQTCNCADVRVKLDSGVGVLTYFTFVGVLTYFTFSVLVYSSAV